MCLPDSEAEKVKPSSTSSVDFQQYQAGSEMGATVPDSGHPNMTFSPPPPPDTPLQHPPMSPSPMSNIPPTQPYPGGYNFEYEFGKQPKDTKSTAWTYSSITNKLYAQKDAMCPVGFKIGSGCNYTGLYIRALPVYSRTEYIQDVVKRCPNHIQAPESANIPYREHFVWCEHQSAEYVKDPLSGRYAVRIPMDLPPAGTPWTKYLFSFKCLNSCVGGPNRREMTMVFTLENANQEVLGRQSIELRICACPGRDRKSDESKLEHSRQTPASHKAITTNPLAGRAQARGVTRSHEMDAIAISKRSRPDNEVFNVTVRGRRNYEMISKIRDSLEMTEQLIPATERERFLNQQQRQQHPEVPRVPIYAPNPSSVPRSSFNFSRGFPNIKTDVVDSTQPCRGAPGVDYTDGCPTSTSSESVASWLIELGLAAYVDNFHSAGFHSMDQLKSEQNFTIKDLENMKLTKSTVSHIWSALKGYRQKRGGSSRRPTKVETLVTKEEVAEPDSQASDLSAQASTVSLRDSVVSLSDNSQERVQNTDARQITNSQPRQLYEVTRCSLKFTVLKRPNNSSQISSSAEADEPESKKTKQ